MTSIKDKWDNLSIKERVEIATEVLRSGKLGSAPWDKLSQDEQDKLTAWSQLGILPAEQGLLSEVDEDYEAAVADLRPTFHDPEVKEDRMRDYLLWVGYQSYPTIRSFIEEAETVGVSRRVSKIPSGLKLGESKIFLAHDEGETGDAVIFGYFIPEAIDVIVYREGEDGIPSNLVGIARPVTVEEAKKESLRGCGYRDDIGAIYLMSGELVVLKPYKDYNAIIREDAHRFRGIKKVDSKKIFKGKNKKAPSEIHRVPATEKIKVRSGEPWTEKERAILKDLLTKFKPWRALREMHKISGRSINAVAYQYEKMRKAAQMEPEEHEENEN